MSVTPPSPSPVTPSQPNAPTITIPSLTPKQLLLALAFVITQAVAFGLLDNGLAQKIIAIGGIVIPAAFAIASALHLGLVHAAIVKQTTAGTHIIVKR